MTENRDNSDKVSRRASEALKLRENRELKREKQRKKKPIKMATLIIVLVFCVYLAAACFVGLRSNLSTTVAMKGSVQEDTRVSGYVFRTQSVINAPWDGHFECLVSEGERVKEGQIIGYIYHTAPDSAVMDKIKKTHRLIRLNGASEDVEYIAGGTGVTEKKISELSRDLSDDRQKCDLSSVQDKKEEINVLIKRKQAVDTPLVTDADKTENTETEAESPGEVERLRSELAALERQAGESVKITAGVGGVFCSHVDGLEDELAYENADTVVPSKISELDKTNLLTEQTVIAGQPLCKIVNNYTWKYAAVLSEKEAEVLQVGQNIQMKFYDLASGSIKGTISRISEIEGGKRAVVISTNRYVDGIYSTSRVSADIVTVDSSGIKLPAGCLRVKDGVTGVYVIRLDTARFVPVNLIYRNDEWAIVSAAEPELGGYKLQIYDEVIVECRNLEDGKIVR